MQSGTPTPDYRQALVIATRAAPQAKWLGLRYLDETLTLRNFRDGLPQTNQVDRSAGIQIEAFVDGHFGYASTSRLDAHGIEEAARRAELNARAAAPFAVHRFDIDQVRPPSQGRYLSPRTIPLSHVGTRAQADLLVRICEKLKTSPRITRTSAMIRLVESRSRYLSTNGADIEQDFEKTSIDFAATAREGNVTQKRTDGGMFARSFQGGFEGIESADLWERVARVARQAEELVLAPDCPTETLPMILMPDQMMLQIHESIGHPLEIDRILGDERNYAGSSFVRLEDIGSLQYGSPLMNVTWNPELRNEFASFAFDDTGARAARQDLIRNGKLVAGIGGLESQARSGKPGAATMRASSWNRAPIDRMSNINLEPGTSTLAEMIASVERGVILETNRSWSIDDYRNKFQFGCEYARLIENGRITGVLKNPNYRGITVPFWHNLAEVGTEDTFEVAGVPFCGKGEPNQAIRVGHASPPCLFRDIEVFGGEG